MVRFERHGRVAVITIDRPEARNAVNAAVANGIQDALDQLESDPELWAGILAGDGPVFCAGADLKEISAGNEQSLRTPRGGFAGITRLPRSKPLIAAVDGLAVAGGCEIVLSCDLIVASTAAGFGIPEVKRALAAGSGGLFRLPRVLPFNVAMQLAMTGEPLGAERAYALGMVNVLCAPGTVVNRALELADSICANAPFAVRRSRKLMLDTLCDDDSRAWEKSDVAWADIQMSDDFAEGPRAFVEKRPPVWTGR